jgi:hypothetical protein
MKIEKITFRSMKNALSKTEMKRIMAGSNTMNTCCVAPGTSPYYSGCGNCSSGTVCVVGVLTAC